MFDRVNGLNEILNNLPDIKIIGNRRISVDNFSKMYGFSSNEVLIKCNNIFIKIIGNNIKMDEYSKSQLIFEGNISSILFEERYE